MSHAKQASTKRKRSMKAVPALGAAGLSLALASGVPAAASGPAAEMLIGKNTTVSQEITLFEEEISDISLATFYVSTMKMPEHYGVVYRLRLAAAGVAVAAVARRSPSITERRHSGATLTRRATRPNPRVYMHRRPNAGTFRNKCSPATRLWRSFSHPRRARGGAPEFTNRPGDIETPPASTACLPASRRAVENLILSSAASRRPGPSRRPTPASSKSRQDLVQATAAWSTWLPQSVD